MRELSAPLRAEVRMLASVLGEVLVEAHDQSLLEDVERLRRATIDLRGHRGVAAEGGLREVVKLVEGLAPDRAEEVARAFTLYFQLVNLAEERQRVRMLRRQSREGGPVHESLAATVAKLRAELGPEPWETLLARLQITLVLTAHPTEARRRAVVEALRGISASLDSLDDPRSGTGEERSAALRLREQVTILWRTSQIRRQRPTPIDEALAVTAIFDESLFRLVPRFCRELERSLVGDAKNGTQAPAWRPFLRWGSWVGADRDGNPFVDHEVTGQVAEINFQHILLALEAASRRIGRSLTASQETTPPSAALLAGLSQAGTRVGPAAAQIQQRAPGEPHREFLLLVSERLWATRLRRPGSYAGAQEFLGDLLLLQESLADAGASRLAYGELQHLVWQAESFGFHLASLEVRQHSSVHRAALTELGLPADAQGLDAIARAGGPAVPSQLSGSTLELLDTVRTMSELQSRYGTESCRRYVVSFTKGAADIVAVRALARLACGDRRVELDVVPLFETAEDLEHAPAVLDELLRLPGWSAWLDEGGRRLEVMLGYSDATKDAGFLAANVALNRAQAALSAWALDHDIDLTLFHGRGGAVGRGGGPAGRGIRSQAAGSVNGRFKVTEQGEVIFARYADASIGLRHLEQVTSAVLEASTPGTAVSLVTAERRFEAEAQLMCDVSARAYHALVGSEGFASFFELVSPLEEIASLPIGSRPVRRSGGQDLADLRAIPWGFAWTQNRCNLPGWYGLGAGMDAVASAYGPVRLNEMRSDWPFFASLLDNAEMSLAKSDPMIAGLYLSLGGRPDLVAMVRLEYSRTRRLLLEVLGSGRLLEQHPVLRQAVDLRNPYVDALSLLQIRFLRELRSRRSAGADTARLEHLVLLTVNGVAAGLQNTG
ncbi:MAG: phosphoenolpyruvate carboxylase [Candidatus Dormibacteraceae bacterium]